MQYEGQSKVISNEIYFSKQRLQLCLHGYLYIVCEEHVSVNLSDKKEHCSLWYRHFKAAYSYVEIHIL